MSGAAPRPTLHLKPGHERRLKSGHPWAFSNELALHPEHREWPVGGLVRLQAADGWQAGTFFFNPHSLIAARRLDRDPEAVIDAAWFTRRMRAAAFLRARLLGNRFHRLVHAEADGLPGLVIDRYDDVLVVQPNAAGMDRLLPEILAALRETLAPRAVVARGDAPVRHLEGLADSIQLLHGESAATRVEEGGLIFPVDPLGGQKTGWFFDQRPNRDLVARLAPGASVLDVFCHTGAFGLRSAAAGAASVQLVDASAAALAQALAAASANGLAGVSSVRGDAFAVMETLAAAGERFDVVICDPPAFVRTRKDQAAGLRGYARMARLAARLVAEGGFLFAASCSHHAQVADFTAAIAEGIHRAGREGRIVHSGGAGPDHPVHPRLPESAYLKSLLVQLD